MRRVRTLLPLWPVTTSAAVTAVLVLAQAGAHTGTPRDPGDGNVIVRLIRASVGADGRQADRAAFGAVVSASGRYVAFASAATTLVAGDRNGVSDVFVRDLVAGRTWRASVSSSGNESDGPSMKPSISADGRVVAFPSSASNLIARDRNGHQDIFVRDRRAGTTERVSSAEAGEANGPSLASLVSGDGRIVVFSSGASNLVQEDDNGSLDVFVADLDTGRLSRVSVGPYGESAARSEASSVDARGLVLAFRSYAANLVHADWNRRADVFVHDRRSGLTERVNVSSAGIEAGKATFRGMVSGDGRFVGFRSRAQPRPGGHEQGARRVRPRPGDGRDEARERVFVRCAGGR